jgi:hypothetical protein
MRDVYYHDNHYHTHDDRGTYEYQSRGVWRRTHDMWDKVLYGIGNVYYKCTGH